MWAGAAGARGAIDLTTFEGKGRRIQGDGEPEKGPAAEAGIRALLEVRKKPGIDSARFASSSVLRPSSVRRCVTWREIRPLGSLRALHRRLCVFDTGCRGTRCPLALELESLVS